MNEEISITARLSADDWQSLRVAELRFGLILTRSWPTHDLLINVINLLIESFFTRPKLVLILLLKWKVLVDLVGMDLVNDRLIGRRHSFVEMMFDHI